MAIHPCIAGTSDTSEVPYILFTWFMKYDDYSYTAIKAEILHETGAISTCEPSIGIIT